MSRQEKAGALSQQRHRRSEVFARLLTLQRGSPRGFCFRQAEKVVSVFHPRCGRFLSLVLPQFLVIALTAAGLLFAGAKYALWSSMTLQSLIVNVFWGLYNILALQWIIAAAFWKPED